MSRQLADDFLEEAMKAHDDWLGDQCPTQYTILGQIVAQAIYDVGLAVLKKMEETR